MVTVQSLSQCTVCKHPKRQEIDELLVLGDPETGKKLSLGEIAKRYGLSKSAVQRHKINGHIAYQVAKAQEAKEIAEADTLLDQVLKLQERAGKILKTAEDKNDVRGACAAIREVRAVMELMAKVTGELKGDGVTVNIIENPQFIEFKQIVMEVMCPECRARLEEELSRIVGR